MPDRPLANRPELYPDVHPIWQAFHDLSADRPPAMNGVAAIPTREIIVYIREMQGVVDRGELQYRYRLLRAMDDEYRLWHQEQSDKQNG